MKFNQPHPKCWGFQVLVEIQIDIHCRNIGWICMPLQLRLDVEPALVSTRFDFPFSLASFGLLATYAWLFLTVKPCLENPIEGCCVNISTAIWNLFDFWLANDTLEHLDWFQHRQISFLYIYVIFNGNSASTATTMTTHMLQFQPETHVLHSAGVWGFGGRNGVQRLGTVDWGAVAALWFIALTLPAWCCPCFHSLHSLHRLFKPSLCLSVGLSAIQTEMLVKGGPDQNRPGNYSSPRICWDIP